jgi:hypothetical protein
VGSRRRCAGQAPSTVTQRNVVSADGKTRTVTTTGVDGQTVNNVGVFEKQ